MSILVNPLPPNLPTEGEISTSLPALGVSPQQLVGAANHLTGWRGRRFWSVLVEPEMDAVALAQTRTNRHRRAGTSVRDVYLPFRPSPEAGFLFVEIEYVSALEGKEITSPAPVLDLKLEELDGTELDHIAWSYSLGTLDITPGIGGPRLSGGQIELSLSPDPALVTTGYTPVPNPGVGDLTPRPLVVGAAAGTEIALHLTQTHSRIFAVHCWEIPEVTL